MVWRIFVHSVRQVFGNLPGVLRVSAVLMIIQIAAQLYFFHSNPELAMLGMDPDSVDLDAAFDTLMSANYFIVILVQSVCYLWIMVGWHRYVLLNETASFVPTFRPGRMVVYFGVSLMYVVLTLILAALMYLILRLSAPILASIIGNISMNSAMMLGIILIVLAFLPVLVVMMRLSVGLPGVALGAGVSPFIGWEATKGRSMTIVGLIVMLGGLGYLEGAISTALFGDDIFSPQALLVGAVLNWVTVMLSASVLTTLYGVFVERRELV
ncbi:hypothetical protein HOY34_19515 [Xinfangfangia sp. D13-10-4-6]|uniref:hypothetical protein n=1 Tax=Pseudogemmobacter hezensis TaxID=2737662 RepID=UPI0015576BFE|nr:hypothetical protein [Pseudogemmobacter hezensis]NPD17378.1 hypothetical protein [Pseudogemmobacter hezensis]